MSSMREIYPITDEAGWLNRRRQDLTSSDAAALCGVSKWTSPWQLWTAKRAGKYVVREETPEMRLGKILEPGIAEHLAREHGFDVEPMKVYQRIPDVRMGSSFDYVARDRSFLLEIKLVGAEAFRRGWSMTDFGLEAPVEIEAQVQQEMLIAEIPLAFIGVLCGTDTYLLRREFQQDVGDRLVSEAKAFWTSPEPEINFERDSDFIHRLYSQATPGKTIDADATLTQLLAEYAEAARIKRIAEDEQDAAKARVLLKIGDAERVQSEIGSLTCGMTKASRVEAYERKPYRQFRFNTRKEQ